MMNRRMMLKTAGAAALGLAIPANVSCTNPRKPYMYVLVVDSYMDKGKVTRGWHCFWADKRNPEDKIKERARNLARNYRSRVTKYTYYSVAELPPPVKQTVTLDCPLAPNISTYASFSCFRTYDLKDQIAIAGDMIYANGYTYYFGTEES